MTPEQKPTDNDQTDPEELKPFTADNPSSSSSAETSSTYAASDSDPSVGDIDSHFDSLSEPAKSAGEEPQQASNDLPSVAQPSLVAAPFQKQRSSKKKIILITLAALLVVLGGAGSAYAFWYNKPDRAVADMFSRTLAAQYGTVDGFFNYASTESKLDTSLTYAAAMNSDGESSFNGKLSIKNEGKSYDLNIAAVASKDRKLYLKAEPLKKLIDSLSQGQPTMFDSIIPKLDGKWLVVSPQDIQKYPEADKRAACTETVLRGFITNKAQQQEVAKLYEKHRFVVVSKDYGIVKLGSAFANHYDVKYDDKTAQAFGDGLVDTDVFKKVDECYKGELRKNYEEDKKNRTENTDQNTRSEGTTKTELWVDALTHAPLKLSLTHADDTTTSLVANFNLGKKTAVTVPKADITVDQLKAEVEKSQQQYINELQAEGQTPVLGAHTTWLDTTITRLLR